MEDQTRQLLRLLADDSTDLLMDLLRKKPQLLADLTTKMPESRQTIVRRLEELQGWGIVRKERRPTPGRGRPATAWGLVDDWPRQFGNAADGMVLDLLDRRAIRQRDGIRQRARSAMTTLEARNRSDTG